MQDPLNIMLANIKTIQWIATTRGLKENNNNDEIKVPQLAKKF